MAPRGHRFSEGSRSVSSQSPPVFDIPKCWVYKCVSSPLAFTWAGDLNSSPHTCAASTVPDGPSLRHKRRHLNKKKQRPELASPHLIPSPALRTVTKPAGTCSVGCGCFGCPPFSVGLEYISFHTRRQSISRALPRGVERRYVDCSSPEPGCSRRTLSKYRTVSWKP